MDWAAIKEQARQAIGDLNVDPRAVEIVGARVLMIIREAIALEREACAALSESRRWRSTAAECSGECADDIAAAIRRRGETLADGTICPTSSSRSTAM